MKISDGSGNDISASPVVESHFTFTGRELDSESGLYFYRARAYDADTGRFLQTDPDPGKKLYPKTHINKYIYVVNNPTRYTDPFGHSIFGTLKRGFQITLALAASAALIYAGVVTGNPVLIGAGIGGAVGTTIAAFNGTSISRGFISGAATGAFIGATYGLGGAQAAGLAGGGVFLGAVTARGNVGENIISGGPLSSGGSFGIESITNSFAQYGGQALAAFFFNKSNCSKSEATDFARQNLCIGGPED